MSSFPVNDSSGLLVSTLHGLCTLDLSPSYLFSFILYGNWSGPLTTILWTTFGVLKFVFAENKPFETSLQNRLIKMVPFKLKTWAFRTHVLSLYLILMSEVTRGVWTSENFPAKTFLQLTCLYAMFWKYSNQLQSKCQLTRLICTCVTFSNGYFYSFSTAVPKELPLNIPELLHLPPSDHSLKLTFDRMSKSN